MPSFPLAPPPPVQPAAISHVPAAGRYVSTTKQFLGNGLVRPFRRDQKHDFATASGVALVQSCVGQVLATACGVDQSQGELAWRTDFGSRLHQLRHRNNDAILSELARVYVVEALQRWEPRVRVKAVSLSRESAGGGQDNVLSIRLLYDVIDANVDGNRVVARDVSQEIQF